MACILELQDQRRIIDMVPQPKNGVKYNAHKLLLAAVPNYCGLEISGAWGCPTSHGCRASAKTKSILNTEGEIEWLRLKDHGDNELL